MRVLRKGIPHTIACGSGINSEECEPEGTYGSTTSNYQRPGDLCEARRDQRTGLRTDQTNAGISAVPIARYK